MRLSILSLAALATTLAACGGGGAPADPTPQGPPAAPWSAAPLAAADVPAPYLTRWRAAENRATCAPLAFAAPRPDAVARAATFGGGWGVAYDTPETRSAYGVAGTGVEPGPDTYDAWPHRLLWADGSRAGYGPEGGSGPKQLAYLRVAGQDCLYNVWSMLGREHLEELLRQLRFVAVDAAP